MPQPPMEIVIFVAWERGRAREKVDQAFAWARTGNLDKSTSSKGRRRIFTPVIYVPNAEDEDLKRNLNGQIYILGHGDPGYGSIGEVAVVEDAEMLTAAEVADRLIRSGLPQAFMGDIKLFNCHSAARSKDDRKDSFADLFAAAMWDREYTHCRIYGYLESLESAYATYGGFGGTYKHSLIPNTTMPFDRAKESRTERTRSL